MLLAEPTPTRFDLRFAFFGVPVRVTPFFWVAAFLLGSGSTGNDPTRILMWIIALFFSILIHELGHVLAYHWYGMTGYIVLYHFGGLAVRSGDSLFSSYDSSFKYSSGRTKPIQQIVISAAGPGAQLMLASIVFGAVRVSGHSLPWALPYLPESWFYGPEQPLFDNEQLNTMILFLMFINVFWALFNLVPVFPLDGGQIARQLFLMFGGANGLRNSLMLSIAAAIGLAVYGLTIHEYFMAMFFGSMAFSSYQLLTSTYGGGFGGRW